MKRTNICIVRYVIECVLLILRVSMYLYIYLVSRVRDKRYQNALEKVLRVA